MEMNQKVSLLKIVMCGSKDLHSVATPIDWKDEARSSNDGNLVRFRAETDPILANHHQEMPDT